MIHVPAGIPLPSGTMIMFSLGISAPAADCFSIYVQGFGTVSQNGIDLLMAFDEDAPSTGAAVFAGISCSWL